MFPYCPPSGGRMCVDVPPSSCVIGVEQGRSPCPPPLSHSPHPLLPPVVVSSGACGGGAPVTGFHFCYRFPGFPISRCCDPRRRRGVRVSVSFAPYVIIPLYCIVPLSCILQCRWMTQCIKNPLYHRGFTGVEPPLLGSSRGVPCPAKKN